jgi:hypothetical protein
LVSGDTEQHGLQVFLGAGKCINCHGGPELTNASLTNVRNFEILERMIMGDDRVAVYDNGQYNIGVRPTLEDIGIGDTIGPLNRPLSNSRLFQRDVQNRVKELVAGNPALTPDEALRQANIDARVPRIRARPQEAARLLAKGANLLFEADSAPILPVIASAEALLDADPPDPTGASALLVQARDALRNAPGPPRAAELAQAATTLLPDPSIRAPTRCFFRQQVGPPAENW